MVGFVDGGSLLVRVRCAFGANLAADPATWVWTDVTAYWHVDDAVDLSWGASSGSTKPETATLGLTFKNTDGRFTAYDPRSPYWPHVREWVPIEYAIDLGDGASWRTRFSGFVRNWAVRWPGGSALMAIARIAAVGELGHQERGKPPTRSPLRRSIGASGPDAYWPVEDGGDAAAVGSALSAHPQMSVSGIVAFAQPQDWITPGGNIAIGSLPAADLKDGGSLSVSIPGPATAAMASVWAIQCLSRFDLGSTASAEMVVLDWTTPGGTFVRWELRHSTLNEAKVIAYDAAGTATTVINFNGTVSGTALRRVTAAQVGGNIDVKLYISSSASPTASATVAGTLAGPTSVAVNPTGVTNSVGHPFGHLVLWASVNPSFRMGNVVDGYGGLVGPALTAWFNETAHDRLARLCAENGVTLSAPAVGADFVTRMGTQPAGTFLDLVQQCVDADQGLLRENGFGLGFTPREARYNAPVALTIDAAAGQLGMPFDPVSEDPNRRNMWTLKREGGSSAVARDDALIQVQGEIEGAATVRHVDDTTLDGHARWRLRRSSAQEPRYPAVSINLGAHPELAAAWCAVVPGSRINVVNPPKQNVPGVVDQIVVGAHETWRGRRSWRVTGNVEPASPWTVAEVDGAPRVAADGSTLGVGGLTDVGTSFSLVSTAENGPWTTDSADFPLLANVNGERVTLSAITGAASPQTATVATGGRGFVKAHPAGAPVDVWEPAVVAL